MNVLQTALTELLALRDHSTAFLAALGRKLPFARCALLDTTYCCHLGQLCAENPELGQGLHQPHGCRKSVTPTVRSQNKFCKAVSPCPSRCSRYVAAPACGNVAQTTSTALHSYKPRIHSLLPVTKENDAYAKSLAFPPCTTGTLTKCWRLRLADNAMKCSLGYSHIQHMRLLQAPQ